MQVTSPSGQCAKLLWSRLLVCRISRFIAVVKTTVAQVQKVHSCGEKTFSFAGSKQKHSLWFLKAIFYRFKSVDKPLYYTAGKLNYKNKKHVQVYKAPWAAHCKIDASLMQTTTSLSPPQKLKCSQTNENTHTQKKKIMTKLLTGVFAFPFSEFLELPDLMATS